MAPQQKPGRSKQDYQTPPEFIALVKRRFGIEAFDCDLAASAANAQAENYLTEADDALIAPTWSFGRGWNWLNPPYGNLSPWLSKAWYEHVHHETHTMVLLPASPGANWWRDWVHHKAHVVFLNGRLTFVGETGPYPKDCALLLYCSHHSDFTPSYDIWSWQRAS